MSITTVKKTLAQDQFTKQTVAFYETFLVKAMDAVTGVQTRDFYKIQLRMDDWEHLVSTKYFVLSFCPYLSAVTKGLFYDGQRSGANCILPLTKPFCFDTKTHTDTAVDFQ